MSIIVCPRCGNRISSLAKICLHCGSERDVFSDESSLVLRQRQARERVYHLKMSSYAVLSVLLAAFIWYWWGSSGFQKPVTPGPLILMSLGGCAYMIVRYLLYQALRKYRELKRAVK